MRAVFGPLMLVILMLPLCFPGAAGAKSRPARLTHLRKSIETANTKWAEAQMRGDARALVALFTDDGMLLRGRAGAVVKGRDSLLAFWTSILAEEHPSQASVTTVDLCLNGKTAAEVGTYSYTFMNRREGPRLVKGQYVVIWREQPDGGWKIYMDTGLPADP